MSDLLNMPRGRPQSPILIVPEIDIMNGDAVRLENWCLWNLREEMVDAMGVLRWLATRRLIRNRIDCDRCDSPFTLNSYQQGIDSFRWCCKTCKATKSVRDGSFFSGSHLGLTRIHVEMDYSRNKCILCVDDVNLR